MKLDARHLRADKLLQAYLALSILRGETLLVAHPTQEMLDLIRQVAPFVKASIKGAGVGSEECVFVPTKIVKKQELNLLGGSPIPLLQTLLVPLLFCGHGVTITLTQTSQEDITTYYIRDVLFNYLHKYIHTATLFKEPNGDVKVHIKGKYLLEAAPPFLLRKNSHLVAVRGELELRNESVAEYIDLTFKDLNVPVRLHRKQARDQEVIHLDALYGDEEGYDNDFAYIIHKDIVDKKDVYPEIDAFKRGLSEPRLSQELIEDLLLFVGLLGGSLPFSYDETDFLLEELNNELDGEIERKGRDGYQWTSKSE